jgi:hypothetical protein
MKSLPLGTILIAAILIAGIARAESPLDEPGFKKATVRSEIKRGFDEIYKSAHDELEPNLTKMANQMHKAESITTSEGSMLGARLAELFVLDFLLRSSELGTNNSAQEITDAAALGHAWRSDIRRRVESLSLSEEQLLDVVNRDFHGLLNRYDTGADASISR